MLCQGGYLMKLGIIESGKFEGRKIILGKDIDKKATEWWIEEGVFLNGSPKFVRTCLKHELLNIPISGCPKCKKEKNEKDLVIKG